MGAERSGRGPDGRRHCLPAAREGAPRRGRILPCHARGTQDVVRKCKPDRKIILYKYPGGRYNGSDNRIPPSCVWTRGLSGTRTEETGSKKDAARHCMHESERIGESRSLGNREGCARTRGKPRTCESGDLQGGCVQRCGKRRRAYSLRRKTAAAPIGCGSFFVCGRLRRQGLGLREDRRNTPGTWRKV